MANRQLRADIVLGGHADDSLYALGNSIEELGRQIDLVGQKLRDTGKQGIDHFVGFEDAMLDARAALATTYTNAGELDRVMDELGQQAFLWANATPFTTVDVANAIANAAHAGWNLDMIMEAIPSAMEIAMAGSMDLQTALGMMIQISNAAGVSFYDLAQMTDVWAFAANKSATTIPEMGEAMQRMGATMQFVGGDMAALTTMLAVLANNGATGATAGTMLRNSMLRLIAPTRTAAEEMGELKLTGEDLDEVYSDTEGLEEAVALLKEAGFSAYTSGGELKSFIDIWSDLAEAVSGMTDQQRNTVLSAIFPTRSLTAALALIGAAQNGWDGLYDSIQQNSRGYAQFAAQTMESGLGGRMRLLESVTDVFYTRTGAALSDDVSAFAEGVTTLLDGVNGMDDAAFEGLVGGLEVLALAGPGLILTGATIKGIAALMGTGPGGWIALGLIAIGALLFGVAKFNEEAAEAEFAEQFGTNSFDETAMGQYLSGMAEGFNTAYESIRLYNEAVERAFSEFETDAAGMRRNLATYVVTGMELTDEQVSGIQAMGASLYDAIIRGIEAQQQQDALQNAFLRENSADAVDSAGWDAIMSTIEYGYNDAIARAQSLSQQLRAALLSAFEDNQLSPDEEDEINRILGEYNQLEAERMDADNAAGRAGMIRKAQQLGFSGLGNSLSSASTARDAAAEAMWDLFYREGGTYSILYYGGMAKIRNGATKADGTPYTKADLDAEIAAESAAIDRSIAANTATYADLMLDMFSEVMRGSDMADMWALMLEAGADGALTDEEILNFERGTKDSDQAIMFEAMQTLFTAMGGIAGVQQMAAYYDSIGDTASGDRYRQMITMAGLITAADNMGSNPFTNIFRPNDAGNAGNWVRSQYGIPETPQITVKANADVSAVEEALDELGGLVVNPGGGGGLQLKGGLELKEFAGGGRADRASIFGEAGPEWAIPEEHSDRTAQLLTEAARASGFTWPDLLSRNGGLNSGGRSMTTLIYSPTVHADDAEGVEEVLMQDKERLERLLEEREYA